MIVSTTPATGWWAVWSDGKRSPVAAWVLDDEGVTGGLMALSGEFALVPVAKVDEENEQFDFVGYEYAPLSLGNVSGQFISVQP